MPEFIPNWHPLAVHFPIALTFTALVLFLGGRVWPQREHLTVAGRWLLYLAATTAAVAAALGWQAYQTVDHDAAGHAAMTLHRNWALATTAGLLLLAGLDGWRYRAGFTVHWAMLVGSALLAASVGVTAWLGGELVYRHGIGVLPATRASVALPAVPEPVTPPAAAPSAPLAPGEHIHKDGSRHRH